MRWWQIDCSGLFIRFCECLGLMTQVQRVTPEAAEAQRVRALRTRGTLEILRMQLEHSAQSAQTEIERIFQTSITGTDDTSLKMRMEEYMQRLAEIRRSVSSPLYLKRPRLEGYEKQIQTLLEQARTVVQQRTTA